MVLKRKITDQDIIEGIMNNDSKTIALIYKNGFDRIKSMVKGFRNINLTPEDVFQEGLTRAVFNVRQGKFKGNSTFSTYLYGICLNLCRKEYNNPLQITSIETTSGLSEEADDNYFDKLQMIIRLKERLDEQCRKIIDLRFGLHSTEGIGTRFEVIAQLLGIRADNARQRFRRCFDKLKTMVFQQKEFI